MPTVDEVIGAYIKLRDHKDATTQRHKEELAPIREKMDKMESWLQSQLMSQGLTNFKGKHGTAYLSTQVSVTVRDRDAFISYVKDNSAWDLIESRCNKSVAQDYANENIEIPGVEIQREQVTNIRRS